MAGDRRPGYAHLKLTFGAATLREQVPLFSTLGERLPAAAISFMSEGFPVFS